MYNDLHSDGSDGKLRVPSADVNSGDRGLQVLDLYARLAADRAVAARMALRHSHSADELLAQSAQALEDAAGTLTLASEMYAEDREAFSELLSQQASAMVVLAAQFEQAADLARTEQGCDR
jgi:hypothetical protein